MQQYVMQVFDQIMQSFLFVVGTLLTYKTVLLVIGFLFPSKKFKPATKQHKFAILVCARNEEQTISQLIASIKKQNYPAELITTFVCAHNCTDKTAEIARNAGAVVYEYNNQKERRKGFALKYLVEKIRKDYGGIGNFDGYFIFDADNLLGKDFVAKMNDAFCNEKYDYFMGYLKVKNFDYSYISSYSGISLLSNTCCYVRPRSLLGLSFGTWGTGILLRANLLERGWRWLTLGEDWEFSCGVVAHGHRGTYIEQAEFFDEQPLTFKILARQRMRWANGQIAVLTHCFVPNLIGIIKQRGLSIQRRLSCFDNCCVLFPLWILNLVYGVFYPLVTLIYGACSNGSYNFAPMFLTVLIYFSGIYCYDFIYYFATIVRESRNIRVRMEKVLKTFCYTLTWPILDIILTYIQFVACFIPVKWKPIPHIDQKEIEDIYKVDHL